MAKRTNKYATQTVVDPEDNLKFGLGRAFSFDSWHNRTAVMASLVSVIMILTFKQVTHQAVGNYVLDGVCYGAGLFFSYLLAQEVDPEPRRIFGALVAAFLTLAGEVRFGTDQNVIVAMFWMLFVVRMFNRTSGARHHVGDNAIILVSAFWLGKEGYWLIPVFTGAAYIVESQLKNGYPRSLYLGALAFCMCLITGRGTETPVLSLHFIYLLGAAFILFLPEFTMATILTARDDRKGRPLEMRRVQMGQAFFLLGTGLLVWFGGDRAARLLLPCMMTAIGCGIYLLIYLVKHKKEINGPETAPKEEENG